MITFGEFIELTSKVNGKRLSLRKDQIDVVFEVAAVTTPEGKYEPTCAAITLRNTTVYMVKETYNQVQTARGEFPS